MNEPERVFREVVGQICWGSEYDSQLNLSLNFGDPHLWIREPRPDSKSEAMKRRRARAVGEWWLWVYIARWSLSVDGHHVTGRSSQKKMRQALGRLDGQKLSDVRVNPRSGATDLEFDLGAKLQIRRWNRTDTDDLWILYQPTGFALAVTSDGRASHQPAREPDEYGWIAEQ